MFLLLILMVERLSEIGLAHLSTREIFTSTYYSGQPTMQPSGLTNISQLSDQPMGIAQSVTTYFRHVLIGFRLRPLVHWKIRCEY